MAIEGPGNGAMLFANEAGFPEKFRSFLDSSGKLPKMLISSFATFSNACETEGDSALIDYTLRFEPAGIDGANTGGSRGRDRCRDGNCRSCGHRCAVLARDRIESHHRRKLPKDDRYTDAIGVELGSRWTAIDSVGLYVPGGTASYPSSVLMNAVPARVAGVERIVMAVPSPDGKLNPLVLVAARLAGVAEIYRIGGAQAVAALAYGTQTIDPVAKIVGPGNALLPLPNAKCSARLAST